MINIYISDLDVILAGKLGVGDIYYTWQNEPRNETKSKMIKVRLVYYATGVSILNSYKEKPPVKKLPIFSEIIKKLSQIYKKLRSDQMDPKSALGGPKPIARTRRSLLKN